MRSIFGTRTERGFTLLELITGLAVLSILITMAIPNFTKFLRDSRLSAHANDFVSSLHMARNEALKRRGRIVVCPSSDGARCAADGNWAAGWMSFVDDNNNADLDSGETLLQVTEAIQSGFTLTGDNNINQYVSYGSDGLARTSAGVLQSGTVQLRSNGYGRNIDVTAGSISVSEVEPSG